MQPSKGLSAMVGKPETDAEISVAAADDGVDLHDKASRRGPAPRPMPAQRFQAAMDGHLSSAMTAAYQADGYLILENMFSRRDCEALMARAADLVDDFDPGDAPTVFSTTARDHDRDAYFATSGGRIHFFLEDGAVAPDGSLNRNKAQSINKIGHALHDLDPIFNDFSRHRKLATVARDLGCAQPLLLQSMYIFKQPGIGGEVVWHQDSTYLYTEPQSVFGLWIALQDATVENGCMWALPRRHGTPLRHRYRYIDGALETETLNPAPWPDADKVPLDVPQGSLVVLHGSLPHRSDTNTSNTSRHAYALHVIDGACDYPADNWLRRPAHMPLRGFDT